MRIVSIVFLLLAVLFWSIRPIQEKYPPITVQLKPTNLPHSKQLVKMQLAAARLHFSFANRNLVREIIDEENFYEYDHFPTENGIDERNQIVYFYHAHGREEHGHFHVFLNSKRKLSHVVGISVDEYGKPIKLFTVNQWVTNETWQSAKKLLSYIHSLEIHEEDSLDGWIAAMIHLYYPQIASLLETRDEIIAENGGRAFLQNRSWEVITQIPISMDQQLSWLLQPSLTPSRLQGSQGLQL